MLKPLLIAAACTLAAPFASQAQTVLPAVPVPAAPAPVQAPVAPAPAPPAVAVAPPTDRLMPPDLVQEKYQTYLQQRYANDRKALSVIRLFSRRQVGGAVFLGVGTALLGTLAAVAGTHNASGGGQVTVTVSPLAYFVYPGPFIGVGIGKLSRFSNRRLFEALDGYDRTSFLPNYVQDRLPGY